MVEEVDPSFFILKGETQVCPPFFALLEGEDVVSGVEEDLPNAPNVSSSLEVPLVWPLLPPPDEEVRFMLFPPFVHSSPVPPSLLLNLLKEEEEEDEEEEDNHLFPPLDPVDSSLEE